MCLLNVSQSILKPGKDIDLMVFTGLNQRIENASCASADIVVMEEPVFSSDNKGFDGAFGG